MIFGRLPERLWGDELGARGAALGALLAPAELVYRIATGAYHAAYDRGVVQSRRAALPVISIGNLTVGGAGKTPVTRWLAERLLARGRNPAIAHGGYAGDEPALHREWLPNQPVLETRDRAAAAAEAAQRGADVLLLDDGFQHRRLRRDLDVVLVAAETWTAVPRLLPRGRWRESPRALERADLVIVTRKSATEARAIEVAAAVAGLTRAAVACVDLVATAWRPAAADGPAFAVAGLAEPRAFLKNARAAGAQLAGVRLFPDHHAYTAKDVEGIRRAAGGRPVVTTEKDWVKLRSLAGDLDVRVLLQEVRVAAGATAIDAALEQALR